MPAFPFHPGLVYLTDGVDQWSQIFSVMPPWKSSHAPRDAWPGGGVSQGWSFASCCTNVLLTFPCSAVRINLMFHMTFLPRGRSHLTNIGVDTDDHQL